MPEMSLRLALPDEAATMRLGEDIALALRIGDVVLLRGELGAGKSTLARALIRAIADDATLEVPSPTFTLVQPYDLRLPIHHLDLYRIAGPDELDELGLDEMASEAALLVEWPDRAAGRFGLQAVTIALEAQDGSRVAAITGGEALLRRIARSLAIREFLDANGWSGAIRRHLTGDASARTYETVALAGQPVRIVMNAPPLVLGPAVRDGKSYAEIAHSARDVRAFIGIDRTLAAGGVSVPRIIAGDVDQGILLIEHLGSGTFLEDGAPVAERYAAAAELLAELHTRHWPDLMPVADGVFHGLPPFDRAAMMIEVELLIDWYVPYMTGEPASAALRNDYVRLWNDALDRIEGGETSILLRDYHSPNIVWRPERNGFDRLGVLDFQDALRGPTAYDVASLAMDARVTIPEHIERSTVEAYRDARARTGAFDRESFDLAYAIMAAQRNSKILGIFVRLDRRDGKPQYLKLLPRIRDYLDRATRHPALKQLRALYSANGFLGDHA